MVNLLMMMSQFIIQPYFVNENKKSLKIHYDSNSSSIYMIYYIHVQNYVQADVHVDEQLLHLQIYLGLDLNVWHMRVFNMH